MSDLELKLLTWCIFFLAGFISGYIVKDQFMKADNEVNVDLTVKKNRLFSNDTKTKKRIFRKANAKPVND